MSVVVFAEEIWVTSTEDAILKLSMDLAGVGISSHVKYKDVIHGFWVWPVCLNPGRDTSSKLGLQLLSLTSP
uniref:Uncharacterized protein n=1 Tax=Helianthus annuus TaxID=4232 RepID=A0A251VH06_HELAN